MFTGRLMTILMLSGDDNGVGLSGDVPLVASTGAAPAAADLAQLATHPFFDGRRSESFTLGTGAPAIIAPFFTRDFPLGFYLCFLKFPRIA